MYNPYDLVSMTINGKQMYGRPTAFDSDVSDTKNMTNSFGNLVKPIQLSTTCPDCGQGLLIDVSLGDPPYEFHTNCAICNPVVHIPDPFINPVTTNIVPESQLDPLTANIDVPVDVESTVEDRLKKKKAKKNKKDYYKKVDIANDQDDFINKPKEVPVEVPEIDYTVNLNNTIPDDFVAYNDTKNDIDKVSIDDLGEEQDFNDDQFVDP